MPGPRILVIGRSGQMAQALAAAGAARGWAIECVGRPEVDLTDAGRAAAVIRNSGADMVINAAAYTGVDKAESEEALAREINVAGVGALARACADIGCGFLHMSTDCVFDGDLDRPYRPDDPVNPLGAYGRSKLDGERQALAACPESLIVRVSWIFSEYGSNFVRTMLRLANEREEVTVVDDQFGCPTYAPDLAAGLLDMAAGALAPGFDRFGTYHLAGEVGTDRASMAEEIFRLSAELGGLSARVVRIRTSGYSTPARRPMNARLDSRLTGDVFGVFLPDWQVGLRASVEALIGQV